jgi:hypothetical protein|tara:strand:- start:53 stop:796 length:744 start_codon:yes stop_codon:yes gene_type:complete
MASVIKPSIVTKNLIFAWNGAHPRCWNGVSSSTEELISRKNGTKNTSGSSTISIGNHHVRFNNADDGNRTAYFSFNSSDITVPTGNEGTWFFNSNLIDAGNVDHPQFGKETSGSWSGGDGFVFGTGWGTDGPRWGIGGTAYAVYASTGSTTGDYQQQWQIWGVTYKRNTTDGLKTYLLDKNGSRLVDERDADDNAIGSNSNALHIGATNSRGGNWNGDFDFLYMYDRELTAVEVETNFNALKGRVNL